MGVIRDKAKLVYATGSFGAAKEPDKSEIIDLNGAIEDAVTGAGAGLVRSDGSIPLTPGTRVGQPGQVTAGAGKGEYVWNGSVWVYAGVYTDAIVLQHGIDDANNWKLFFNSAPLVLDQFGLFDGTARLYVPRRKYYANPAGGLDVNNGTADALFQNHTAYTITRFRENDPGAAVYVYYDLDDPTNPVKQVSYNATGNEIPRDRPTRVIPLIVIYTNGFYSSPVRVVEIQNYFEGRVWPAPSSGQTLNALVKDGNDIFMPAFQQYHDGVNFGTIAPTAPSTYFKFTFTGTDARRVYYNDLKRANGAVAPAIFDVALNGAYPKRSGYRLHELFIRDSNGNIKSNVFPIAKKVPNLWPNGFDIENVSNPLGWPANPPYGSLTLRDTPPAVSSLGYTFKKMFSCSSSRYVTFGDDLPFDSKGGETMFIRLVAYMANPADWPVGNPGIINLYGHTGPSTSVSLLQQSFFGYEEILSDNVRVLSGRIKITDGIRADSFRIGFDGQTNDKGWVGGAQLWVGHEDFPWIERGDYLQPLDKTGTLRPLIGKDLWMVKDSNGGRKLPLYLENALGIRNPRQELVTAGFYSVNYGKENYPYAVEAWDGKDQVSLDPGMLSQNGFFYFMRRGPWARNVKREKVPVTNHVAQVPLSSPKSPKIAFIGASQNNRGLYDQVNKKLGPWNITPTWIGTVPSSRDISVSPWNDDGGPLGEAREGRGFLDILNRDPGAGLMLPAYTDVAAYKAGTKDYKVGHNPFVRAATGADPSGNVFNGTIFDYRYYLDTYELDDPDMVIIGIGTNDIIRLMYDAPAMGRDGIRIMMQSIAAALPSAQIAYWFPSIPYSSTNNFRYDVHMNFMRAVLGWIMQSGNASRMKIIPTHIHMSAMQGWDLTYDMLPDVTDNVISTDIVDEIHFGRGPDAVVREQVAETIAAYVANISATL